MLRVDTIEEIFAAVETLARAPKFPGDRLSVITNGGGIGVMAVDRLAELGGRLAERMDGQTEGRMIAPAGRGVSRGGGSTHGNRPQEI